MREVAVTGLGFATCIGACRDAVVRALTNLETGIRPWRFGIEHGLGVRVAGAPVGFGVESDNPLEWTWPDDCGAASGFDPEAAVLRSLPPHGLYALWAVRQAVAEAGLDPETLGDGRTGLHTASAGSPRLQRAYLDQLEASGWRRIHPLALLRSIAGTLSFNLAPALGIRGADCGFVSACTSGSHALGFAVDEIRLGRQDRVIVVAAEDITAESLLPFAGMGALSLSDDPESACRPFDRDRDGFVGAGGAAAIVLEAADSARERGARVQARIPGWGHAADGHHPASPDPEGRGVEAAVRNALADAGAGPEAVGYVNAHAPSTKLGDKAEAAALRRVFGGDAPTVGPGPCVSSTKALTGHGLSLSGALEAAICVLAVDEGITPGQAHLRNLDPECAGIRIPLRTEGVNPGIVLNCSSGFGGANVCHVIAAPGVDPSRATGDDGGETGFRRGGGGPR